LTNGVSPFGTLIRLPLRLIPKTAVFPILRGRARGMRWITGSSNHGCWLGTFEYEKSRLFERTVTAGQVVYDVGANAGYYALLGSCLVGPSGLVVAFEPSPENLTNLRRHVELNHLSNVTILPIAVGEHEGTCAFELGPTNAMGRLSTTGRFNVDVVDLDTFVAAGKAPPPDVIKMDIEGGELAALKGAAGVIDRVKPAIFLATHTTELQRYCVAFLRAHGYGIASVTGSPLDEPGEIVATPTI
jgi:FkbM family methyltransferase